MVLLGELAIEGRRIERRTNNGQVVLSLDSWTRGRDRRTFFRDRQPSVSTTHGLGPAGGPQHGCASAEARVESPLSSAMASSSAWQIGSASSITSLNVTSNGYIHSGLERVSRSAPSLIPLAGQVV